MGAKRCPKCGSDDVEPNADEYACCCACGYEGRKGAFDPDGERV